MAATPWSRRHSSCRCTRLVGLGSRLRPSGPSFIPKAADSGFSRRHSDLRHAYQGSLCALLETRPPNLREAPERARTLLRARQAIPLETRSIIADAAE